MFEYYNQDNITSLPYNEVFVFGSNEAGRHGAGAAKVALRNFGAQYGVSIGRYKQSYAIPTQDRFIETLGIGKISEYVDEFIHYARSNPETTFIVIKVGCGLAGYSDSEIAPLFKYSPNNCKFHIDWKEYLE
jgi:hypothetical protein